MRKPWIGRLAWPLLAASLAVGAGAGCGRNAPPVYPTWATPPPAYVPQSNSGNAFDEYALAALEIESAAPKNLTRVSFYPEQRKGAMEACAPALARVDRASRLPCTFKFVAHPPFHPAEYRQGWRLMGRVLRWRIEDACREKDFEKAIDAALLATRFGFDLTGGGATDASLGLAIADDARAALAPYLPELGAGQLARLAKGLQDALTRKPPISEAVSHEGENMKLAVQALQDAFQKNDFKEMSDKLGPDVKDAVEYMERLRGRDEKRIAYFQAFAAEGDATQARMMRNAALPMARREKEPEPDPKVERPWRRFAHHFFTTCAPLLEMNDRTLARTRMFAISAEVYRVSKVNYAFPKDLRFLAPDLTIDPYTGVALIYRADPSQFSVYSVGEDLRDDNGDSDPTFLRPDLRLEASN